MPAAGTQGNAYAAQEAASCQANIPPANLTSLLAPGDSERVDDQIGVSAAASEQPTPRLVFALRGTEGAASTTPARAATNSSVGARTAGQIPIHAAKTSPGNHAINSIAASGTMDEVGEQEDPATLPQALSKPEGNATASSTSADSVKPLVWRFGIEERGGIPAGDIAEHRPSDVSSATSAIQTTRMVEGEGRSANSGPEKLQSPLNETAHQTPLADATPTASQQTGAHGAVAQSSGIEVSAMVRDPASTHGTVNTPATIGGSTASLAPAPQETFAALDAGTTVGAPSWVHAGGRQAEAGFEDPALGWVGVRADLSGGSVHAALVPGSADAAQALSGHLAGLSTYLSEQHTPVATMTVAAPGSSGIDAGPDQSLGQGMQQSAGQQGEQNPASAFEMGSQPGLGANVSSLATGGAAAASGFDATAYARDGRGAHISVMA